MKRADETCADMILPLVDIGDKTIKYLLPLNRHHPEIERKDLRSLSIGIRADLTGLRVQETTIESSLDLLCQLGVLRRLVGFTKECRRLAEDGCIIVISAGRGDGHRRALRTSIRADLDPVPKAPGDNLVRVGFGRQPVHVRNHGWVAIFNEASIAIVLVKFPRGINNHAVPPHAIAVVKHAIHQRNNRAQVAVSALIHPHILPPVDHGHHILRPAGFLAGWIHGVIVIVVKLGQQQSVVLPVQKLV